MLRAPRPEDGPGVSALIAACRPLDTNSAYCNLIQCTHFAGTCVLAERGGKLVGWLSAHRPPSAPDQVFVWQAAVHPRARRSGLGLRMLEALMRRPAVGGARWLTATTTEINTASRALFAGFARKYGLELSQAPLFDRVRHFAGAHDTEWQLTVGPLPAPFQTSIKEET